ncbi:hypothetical protein DPMN_069769 [Dreissena polymorpha]|uniref:Secreted protein n=1 Tax=Dreissena polymorpha TaxID=45954 RepID=A0A9D3Z4Y1_DREPO|nr:hypothetical protein DPMN_069769 [Dreissena polymorpha]
MFLFHWRVLAALLRLCSQEVRDNFLDQRFDWRPCVVQATGSTQTTESMQTPGTDCCLAVQAIGSTQATESMQRPGPDLCMAVQTTGSTRATELIQGAGSDRSVVVEA